MDNCGTTLCYLVVCGDYLKGDTYEWTVVLNRETLGAHGNRFITIELNFMHLKPPGVKFTDFNNSLLK